MTLSDAMRRLVLLGAPLTLAVLEALHPRPEDATQAIESGDWFLWFHMVQLPLVGLVAVAVYLLTAGLEGPAVATSRWATGVFVLFFGAYDAAAGIATGFVWRTAQSLPSEDQAVVFSTTKDMPDLSIIFVLSVVGTVGWVVALVAAALALRHVGIPRGPFLLLILAGVFLMGGHPFPFGTLAFGCLFLAAAWLELTPGDRPVPASTPSRAGTFAHRQD